MKSLKIRNVSQLFQPVITIPRNAKIKNTEITCKSQKLLLECGLIRPTSSGLFALLPLARRAIDKLERLIISGLESAGAQRVSLPSLTAASLWQKTGRLDAIGADLLQLKDRHSRSYVLAPTYEESVADLFADIGHLSYKNLPLIIYQISDKYRDEPRPKHGLLRARGFSMMDAYGIHSSDSCAEEIYRRITNAYRDLFTALRLPVHRVEAPSGDMGGSISHEWQLCAKSGDDALSICPSCSHATIHTEDKEGKCEQCGEGTEKFNSIEVGHTFVLGAKYSTALHAHVTLAGGSSVPLLMSCYGIGVTRLLAASLEALSSEEALRWPTPIAPYTLVVIGPKEGSREWCSGGEERLREVSEAVGMVPALEGEVLVDDRHSMSIGKRLQMANKTGYPLVVVCGKSSVESTPRYELHRMSSDPEQSPRPELLTLEELLSVLQDHGADHQLVNKINN